MLYALIENKTERRKIIRAMRKTSILDNEYKCSVWKAVLHFYLAHRLAIIKRKNKMNLISYETITKLMENYLPETLKNGDEKELLRKWCLCYMFWAVMPREQDHWWVFKEYSDESTGQPAGIAITKISFRNKKSRT